jgi:branched-chain amino acid transport system substrate-binding protein
MTGAKVEVVGSEDGQRQVHGRGCGKLVGQGANVIIGEMASGATIPMAQSVTIPDGIVTLSPTASAPQIDDQGRNPALAAVPVRLAAGQGLAPPPRRRSRGVLNIGARNDAFGTALAAL